MTWGMLVTARYVRKLLQRTAKFMKLLKLALNVRKITFWTNKINASKILHLKSNFVKNMILIFPVLNARISFTWKVMPVSRSTRLKTANFTMEPKVFLNALNAKMAFMSKITNASRETDKSGIAKSSRPTQNFAKNAKRIMFPAQISWNVLLLSIIVKTISLFLQLRTLSSAVSAKITTICKEKSAC